MTEPWIIYLLVFVLVAVAAQQFQRGLGSVRQDDRDKRRRFASLAPPVPADDDDIDALRRRASRFAGSPLATRITRLIVQSGTSLSPSTLRLVVLGTAVLIWFLLPSAVGGPMRPPVAVVVAVASLWVWLQIKRARRMARFGEQLPDVIDVIVRSLRAGHPLAVSLSLVARDTPDPAGREFALVVDEMNYGRGLAQALNNLYGRVGYPELRFFVASTAIAHQTGGNLGEILSRLSGLLRERFRLTRRVWALSAEGRFSGYALSVLPVALFGLINVVSASYYAEFWTSAAATPIAAVSVGLLVLGNLVIYRLVNFRV